LAGLEILLPLGELRVFHCAQDVKVMGRHGCTPSPTRRLTVIPTLSGP
jgi:hypothetical protein